MYKAWSPARNRPGCSPTGWSRWIWKWVRIPIFVFRLRFEGADIQPFFNAEGHHVIALSATQDLEQRSPVAMLKVRKILDDGGRTVERAATFPDDLRQQQPATKHFHFIDIPFTDDGPANPILPPAPHAVSKMRTSRKFSANMAAAHKNRWMH